MDLTDWPIWMCLKNPESLKKLVKYQKENHGVNLLLSPEKSGNLIELEDIEELTEIMEQPPGVGE